MAKALRHGVVLLVFAGTSALVGSLTIAAANAQSSYCPAGGRGGSAGTAGRSTAGTGGLAFTVGGFGTTGSASAPGANAGSAAGGSGGRGGSGTLPICNQNTNGVPAAAPAATRAAAPLAAPVEVPVTQAPEAAPVMSAPRGTGGGSAPSNGAGGGAGAGLARTGSHTNLELGLAGFAFVLGGMLLFFATPAKQMLLRAVGAAPRAAKPVEQDWEVLGWSPPFRPGS